MQNQQKKALIIGCGIAGPALALFLKRAGFQAEIYEAREIPEGFALSLSGNGVAVLQELGLDGAAFGQGSAVTKWLMWNRKGKQLGGGVLAGEGVKSVFIKRVPLGMIIADEAERPGIKIGGNAPRKCLRKDNLLCESSVRNRLLETEQFKLNRPTVACLAPPPSPLDRGRRCRKKRNMGCATSPCTFLFGNKFRGW